LGSLTFGGVGLLTASRAQKIESISGLINLVMMPMWIFSGVFFSYERFPAVIHPLIKALPLTALNDALRASILEGTPLLPAVAAIAGPGALGWDLIRAGAEVVPLDVDASGPNLRFSLLSCSERQLTYLVQILHIDRDRNVRGIAVIQKVT
jgi:hypothetical protein